MKSLPGHSSLQDWVPVPSAVLQTAPLLAGVLAVLVLVLSRLPDPSFAAQELSQLDHEVHISHWQSTERTHVSHIVTMFQFIKVLPGHSSVHDWVPVPSIELQAAPLLAGVFAVLNLVLSWLPDPSFAAQESVQLDHGVHASHWQSTEKLISVTLLRCFNL